MPDTENDAGLLADLADADTTLFVAIEKVNQADPNPSTAADAAQDVFVAWLREKAGDSNA